MALPGHYSFRGVAFDIERSGDLVTAPPPPETLESRRQVPFSDIVIVDDGGSGLRIWSTTIVVDAANMAAMEANRRQIGSLVTPDETWSGSKLSRIGGKERDQARQIARYQVEFIVN